MFNLLQRAYNQAKPFVDSSYAATSNAVAAVVYTAKASVQIALATAYTTKAVVKTAYYGVKHTALVAPAAYNYYTAETPAADTAEGTVEKGESLIAEFNLLTYTHAYNQNWRVASEDFSNTAHTFVADVSTPVYEAADSFAHIFYNTLGCAGNTIKASGEGLLLATAAAEYCLGETAKPVADVQPQEIDNDYELVNIEDGAVTTMPAPAA